MYAHFLHSNLHLGGKFFLIHPQISSSLSGLSFLNSRSYIIIGTVYPDCSQNEDERACVADKGEFADFARRSSRPEEKGEFALGWLCGRVPSSADTPKTLVTFPWLLSFPK